MASWNNENSYQNAIPVLPTDPNAQDISDNGYNSPYRHFHWTRPRNRWWGLVSLLVAVIFAGVQLLPAGKGRGDDSPMDLTSTPDLRAQRIFAALQELQTEIQGTVFLYQSNDDNESSRSAFSQAAHVFCTSASRNDKAPWAVIEVETEADVQTTILVLGHLKRTYDFPFRVRSGGHNKAGYSTVARGAVLSLRRMTSLQLVVGVEDQSAVARMGPAVLVRQFIDEVLKPYGYGGVIGFCGTVAEAGFVLGGGIGLQSRIHGLGLDNVVGMRIVLADGRVRQLRVSSRPSTYTTSSAIEDITTDGLDQDLFWALRGAGGGSFGVVTELEYQVHKTSNRLHYSSLTLPAASDMATFLYRLGQREHELPDNFLLMHDQVDTAGILWSGRTDREVDGAAEFIDNLVQELLPSDAPSTLNQSESEWTAMFDGFDESWAPDAYATRCWYGFLFPENNTEVVWQSIMHSISTGVRNATTLGLLLPDIEQWGGAIRDTPWNATAFPHRSALYNVGVLLTVPTDEPQAAAVFDENVARVNAWWPQVEQYLTGSYVNYPTTSLLQQDYARVYWGESLPRLVDIKQRVDPENIFEFPMSVPLEV